MSPKKVSDHHKIYIQPLGKNILKSPGPNKAITYEFPGSPMKDSPAKNLINRIVGQSRPAKRALINDDDNQEERAVLGNLFGSGQKITKIPRKLESLISDRQEQNRD